MRDRRALARYAGLTGSPDESGAKRREKGLARSGNARVRRGLIQLAWRFLVFQKDSALVQWYRARTAAPGVRKATMIVALARKLLVALWRMVTAGQAPRGSPRITRVPFSRANRHRAAMKPRGRPHLPRGSRRARRRQGRFAPPSAVACGQP